MLLRFAIAVVALTLCGCATALPDEAAAIRTACAKFPTPEVKLKACASMSASRQADVWDVRAMTATVGGEYHLYLSRRSGRLLSTIVLE
jgi:hypothetical protein